MAAPLILARTFKDAHAFARESLGLSFGNYRVVNSAGTLKAVRGVDLYLVAGWDKRPDRFTMQSALKWSRLNVIDTTKAPVEAPAPEPVEDERYPNDERTQTIALRYNTLLAEPVEDERYGPHGNATTVSLEEALAMQDPALAEMPEPAEAVEAAKPKRRSRCKECGQLHYKTDPCPEVE